MTTKRTAVSALAIALAVGAALSAPASAQDSGSGITAMVPSDKQWDKNKAMPFGMKVLPLYGDPTKPGPYAYRLRVPTGYKWPPMKFPDDHVTTVIKGVMWLGEGERYDAMKMKELEAGAMYTTKANTPHYQWARTEVVLQIMGNGPVSNPVTYLNPDDDPRGE